MTQHLRKRFDELQNQAKEIAATEKTQHSQHRDSYQHIDSDLILGWCVKARHLLSSACGPASEHYRSFVDAEPERLYEPPPNRLKRVVSVFLAAKEDFEGGYLTTVRNLVQAEVFSNELEQASELLRYGYYVPAAVIAGVVLETALADLCARNSIPIGKANKMNDDLTKAGQYNSLVQKRVTSLAAIRNSAAHGKSDEFTKEDVSVMIADVERFLSTWLT